MSIDTERITVSLSDEDYKWVVKQSELTGNSLAGILRQMVRASRLGRPELLHFSNSEVVSADEPVPTEVEEDSEESDEVKESSESGLEAFTTQ